MCVTLRVQSSPVPRMNEVRIDSRQRPHRFPPYTRARSRHEQTQRHGIRVNTNITKIVSQTGSITARYSRQVHAPASLNLMHNGRHGGRVRRIAGATLQTLFSAFGTFAIYSGVTAARALATQYVAWHACDYGRVLNQHRHWCVHRFKLPYSRLAIVCPFAACSCRPLSR